MSRRPFFWKFCPALMICVISLGISGISRAADPVPRGRTIQITEPRNDRINTNVNQLGGTATGLKNLEDDLAKPLRSFNMTPSLTPSLEGVTARPIPTPRAYQSQRNRALNDLKKNWAFATPEELLSTPSDDTLDMMDLDKIGELENQSSVERYYDRMFGKRAGSSSLTNRLRGANAFGRRSAGDGDVDTDALSGDLGHLERSLRKELDAASRSGPAMFGSSPMPGAFADLFKFNSDNTPTPESLRVQKEQETRIDNFKKLWQPPVPAMAPPIQPQITTGPGWNFGGGNAFSPGQSRPFDPAASPFNSSVSGMPGFSPAPSPVPSRTNPKHPDFSIPRRSF